MGEASGSRMDSARILFSLPSELAEIKRKLLAQQNELRILEQLGEKNNKRENNEGENKEAVDDCRDDARNGRIVIDVEKPKTVALKNKIRYKSESKAPPSPDENARPQNNQENFKNGKGGKKTRALEKRP